MMSRKNNFQMNHAVSRTLTEENIYPPLRLKQTRVSLIPASNYHKQHNDIFSGKKTTVFESVKRSNRINLSKVRILKVRAIRELIKYHTLYDYS